MLRHVCASRVFGALWRLKTNSSRPRDPGRENKILQERPRILVWCSDISRTTSSFEDVSGRVARRAPERRNTVKAGSARHSTALARRVALDILIDGFVARIAVFGWKGRWVGKRLEVELVGPVPDVAIIFKILASGRSLRYSVRSILLRIADLARAFSARLPIAALALVLVEHAECIAVVVPPAAVPTVRKHNILLIVIAYCLAAALRLCEWPAALATQATVSVTRRHGASRLCSSLVELA